MILGTAAYMSPEQARGKPLDRRTDSGRSAASSTSRSPAEAFSGETVSDTIASVLEREPDWGALPASIPPGLRRLVQRCLAKDAARRLRDLGDARIEIEESASLPTVDLAICSGGGVPSRRRERIAWAVAAALAVALGLSGAVQFLRQRSPAAGPVARIQVDVAPARQLGSMLAFRPYRTSFTLLPDGRAIVFSGYGDKGPQLYLRSLDRWEAGPISGTEGGSAPFLSPDGRWIGFYADNTIKKVQIGGGTAAAICEYPSEGTPFGASWGTDDTIFLADDERLLRVPAAGGKPEVLLAPDRAKGEEALRLPHVLPGGRALLFTTQTSTSMWSNPRVELLSLDTGARKVLLAEGADARYSVSGHLVFMRQGTLCAAPFDLSRLEVTGPEVALVDDVMQAANTTGTPLNSFAGQFSLSPTGTLAYVTGGPDPDSDWWLLWVDPTGAAQPVLPASGPYLGGRLSPDGRSVVYSTLGKNKNIHVVDLERGASMRLTAGDLDSYPVWTPDGKRVAFSRNCREILWVSSSGSGEPEVLIESKNPINPSSWSPHGDLLAYVTFTSSTSTDIGILRVADRRAEPFLATRFNETNPEFSPDGQWLAYVSDLSGKPEVYVESLPDRPGKIKISTDGGSVPCWSRDGSRLYYVKHSIVTGTLMVVDATAKPRFGVPRTFLDTVGNAYPVPNVRRYDIDPKGRLLTTGLLFGGRPVWKRDFPEWEKILISGSREDRARLEYWLRADPERRLAPKLEQVLRQTPVTRINIVENWMEELKRLAPTR